MASCHTDTGFFMASFLVFMLTHVLHRYANHPVTHMWRNASPAHDTAFTLRCDNMVMRYISDGRSYANAPWAGGLKPLNAVF